MSGASLFLRSFRKFPLSRHDIARVSRLAFPVISGHSVADGITEFMVNWVRNSYLLFFSVLFRSFILTASVSSRPLSPRVVPLCICSFIAIVNLRTVQHGSLLCRTSRRSGGSFSLCVSSPIIRYHWENMLPLSISAAFSLLDTRRSVSYRETRGVVCDRQKERQVINGTLDRSCTINVSRRTPLKFTLTLFS